jgi:hypothetical protein
MTAIRPITKAAFRVEELVYQFEEIDVPDGLLQTASINEVNEKYSDEHLIGEARHRLDLVEDQLNYWDAYMLGDDGPVLRRDKRQLVSFIKKWSK